LSLLVVWGTRGNLSCESSAELRRRDPQDEIADHEEKDSLLLAPIVHAQPPEVL